MESRSPGQIINLVLQFNQRSVDLQLCMNLQEFTQKIMMYAFEKGQLYEPEVCLQLTRLLQEGDAFIDVGAHIGYFSMLASACVGDRGTVIACEPETGNYQHILQHAKLNQFHHLRVLKAAVGEETKAVQFFVNADNDGGHALWDVGQHAFNQKSRVNPITRTVNMVTLDLLVDLHQLENLKLVKIDTEGAEHKVLRGAIQTLSQAKVPYIIAEVNRFGLQQMETDESQLRAFMRSLGYDTYLLTADAPPRKLRPEEIYETNQIFNVLFSNREVA